jgi:hypothetical protein
MKMMARAPLVLGLALARTERALRPSTDAVHLTIQTGRAVVATPQDGTVLAENDDGVVLLVLASDATIRGLDGPLPIEDLRAGDMLRWVAETHQRIAMIDELRVTERAPERRW